MAEYTNKEVAQLMLVELHRWYNKEVEYSEEFDVSLMGAIWLGDGTRYMLCKNIPNEVCLGCSLCDNPVFNDIVKDVALGVYSNDIGSFRRLSYIADLIHKIEAEFAKDGEVSE